MNETFNQYVVYRNPSDYPDKFVVRRFVIGFKKYEADKHPVCVVDTLKEARSFIPPNLINIGRMNNDDPVILEVWT